MTFTGKFRIYFNRHGAEPLMWCVAPEDGSWEIAVRSVALGGEAMTVFQAKATPDEDDGKPSAWIATEGKLTILTTGHARIAKP